jgi:segregation and condensation protein A
LSYEIKLPLFEGPFDLLLFFIERDELNIHDIPIARITDDFLALNMDLASEFILVAATLMRIKAKLLFPRPQVDEKGNEIDPRKELVQHLLEYKKYKSVVEQLSALEENRASQEVRGNVVAELRTIASRSNVDAELDGPLRNYQ